MTFGSELGRSGAQIRRCGGFILFRNADAAGGELQLMVVSGTELKGLVAEARFEHATLADGPYASGPSSVSRAVTVARRGGSSVVTISHTRPSSITA